MMGSWMGLIGAALACGGPTETRVVGFSADGSLALVRFEEQDEAGKLHDLRLELLDVHGKGRGRQWTILEPKDDGNAQLRATRWSAAEPEIAAAGIVLDPDLKPTFEIGIDEAWTLPGKDYDLREVSYSYGQGDKRRWELHARRGELDVVVTVLHEDANAMVPFSLGKVYLNPTGTHMVLVDAGTMVQKAIPVAVADVEAALKP